MLKAQKKAVSAMDEPLNFRICRAEAWAMESSVRNRLLSVDGVESVRVRLGEGRVSVTGRSLSPDRILAAARQAGCELEWETSAEEGAVDAPVWPVVQKRSFTTALGGAVMAGLAGLMLAAAEHFQWLPATSEPGAEWFWFALGTAVLLLGVVVMRLCLGGIRAYPGIAVLASAGVLLLGALGCWLQTLFAWLYVDTGAPGRYGHLDTALIAVSAAAFCLVMGRRSWAGVQAPLLDRLPPCPKTVRVLREGLAQSLPVAHLRAGEMVHAVMGDAIAADGVVTRGNGTVDESAVTGRTEAQSKREGDEVLAGSCVRDGDLVYCINRTGQDTVMASLLAAARGIPHPPGRRDTAARVWPVLVAALLALATTLAWLTVAGATPGLAVQIGLTGMMFVAPVGFLWSRVRVLSGITARLAQAGVLARSHTALVTAARVRTILFDQGLSLTVGEPEVMGVEPAENVRVRDLFTLAASVEADSRHPLAEAIISAALERDLPILPASEFESIPQEGVVANVGGRRVLVGNARLLQRYGVPVTLEERGAEMADDGRVVVHVAADGRHIGLLAVDDAPADGAAETVRGLRQRGVEAVLVSGASRRSTQAFGRLLGIDNVWSELSGEQKAEVAATARKAGGPVGVVARAGSAGPLQQADLGIVLRGPGDDAHTGGDIVLFSGLTGLLQLMDLTRHAATVAARVRYLAIAYLLVVLPLATGVAFPWLGWFAASIAAPIAAAVAVIILDAHAANPVPGAWSMDND